MNNEKVKADMKKCLFDKSSDYLRLLISDTGTKENRTDEQLHYMLTMRAVAEEILYSRE